MMDNNPSSVSPGAERFEINQVSQRAIFLAALIPGALAIIVSRVFLLSGFAFVVVAIAIPVACMLTYWAANVRGDFFDGTRAQVADNIYFLGFLYFLVSLSATLMLFAAHESIEQRVVVEGFGIALVTTILGLFLRIFVLLQSAPVEESVEKAELDLLRTIRESSANIAAGSEALRKAQDVAIAGMVEMSKVLLEKTVAATVDMNRKVALAVTSIEERLTKVEIPPDLFVRALAPVLQEIRGAVDEFGRSARDQAQAGRELAASVKDLVEPIQNATGAVATMNQAVAQARPGVEAIGQSVSATAVAAAEVAKSMNIAHGALQGLSKTFAELDERVRGLQVDAKLAETLAQFKSLQEELLALKRAMSELAPMVQSSVGTLPVVVEQFKGLAGELKQAAVAGQELVTGVERLKWQESVQGALAEANAVITNLRQLEAAVAEQLERARRLVQPGRSEPPRPPPPMPPAQRNDPRRNFLNRLFGRN